MTTTFSRFITTVITTYNRSYCVSNSINSAILAFPGCQIILVDDASTDDTLNNVKASFYDQIQSGQLRLISLDHNVGVAEAKNIGYEAAHSDWVFFLDSDDTFIAGVEETVQDELIRSSNCPIVFFRCVDQNGQHVGANHHKSQFLDLRTYLRCGSQGEALTAINKKLIFGSLPYQGDLRGYEGLGCCRIIKQYGSAHLSSLVLRVYYRGREDALSSFSNMLNRSNLLAKGHRLIIKEFSKDMSLNQRIYYKIKALIYELAYRLSSMRHS